MIDMGSNRYFLTFQPTEWTNSKRLEEIQLPMKNPFSTPGQTVGHAHEELFSS